MQDDNRFFRFLNRVNAIILPVAGIAVLVFIAVSAFPLWYHDVPPERFVAQGVIADTKYKYAFSEDPHALGEADMNLGLIRLDGTNESMLVLKRVVEEGGGSLSRASRGDENANLLLIDLDTAKSHWMFAGTNRNIMSSFEVRAAVPTSGGASNPVVTLLLTVVDADTNKDGQFNGADDQVLYVYRPGAPAAFKLMSARSISYIAQIDSGKVFVVFVTYSDGKSDHLMLLAKNDFKPIAQNTLVSTPK